MATTQKLISRKIPPLVDVIHKYKLRICKESEMKKRTILIIVGLVLAVGLFFGGRSIYYEFYPVPKEPSAEWEPFVSALDAKREAFFVENDGIKIEAELFIPNAGEEQKPAVVFSPGSGDALYQNYAPGFVETYILDLFLLWIFLGLLSGAYPAILDHTSRGMWEGKPPGAPP